MNMKNVLFILLCVYLILLSGCADEPLYTETTMETTDREVTAHTVALGTTTDSRLGEDTVTSETQTTSAESMIPPVVTEIVQTRVGEVIEQVLTEGVEVPEIFGWSHGISTYFGVPIKLSLPERENVMFHVQVQHGGYDIEIPASSDGTQPKLWQYDMHTEFVVPNGVTMYWRSDVPTYTETGEYYDFDGEFTYTDIVIYENDMIIGYAAVKIYSINQTNTMFRASLEKAVIFPFHVNDEYQDISPEYVRERMAVMKAEVRTTSVPANMLIDREVQ